MTKVAVTGAGGKVGRQVIKELKKKGYKVLSITHSPKDIEGEQISLDIRKYTEVYQALKGCDAVIHLAGIPSPLKDNNSLVIDTNVTGTYNVLLAAGELNIKNVAVASSDCTLGFTFSKNRPVPEYLPVDEKHPLKPDDCYGLSKVLMEREADAMVQRFPGMSIASLRITYIANPEEYQGKTSFKGWTKNPEQGPWNLWSYIDNRDAARAFRKAIETNLGGHEIFFIAADNTRCQLPTKNLIKKYYPEVPVKKKIKNYESLENNSKAERLLDFIPEYKWND
ncbi:MAG: NAD-dependent epimerase/dehydratase family protein [bacterium]